MPESSPGQAPARARRSFVSCSGLATTNELKEKVAEHPEVLDPPSTVHSFAIATLLANPGSSGLPEPIRIADDWEWNELIRVIASLAALLTPHLRDRMPGPGDLDGTGPLEVSSTPDPTPAEGEGDGE